MGLLKILITTSECCSVKDYINKIINTAHKLRGVGMQVSDEWIGTLLLAGLPEEYKPMIMGLESPGIDISADSIQKKILQDVKEEPLPSNEAALFSKNKTKNSSSYHYSQQSRSKKSSIRCFGCNGYGHFSKNCPKKYNKTKEKNEQNHVLLTSYKSRDTKGSDDWFIDSGASAHMTWNKHNLINVRSAINNEVVVANNNILKIQNVGDVRLTVSVHNESQNVLIKNVQ